MTDPYGVIDLSSLGQQGNAPDSATGEHEIAVTEQGLDQIVADSQTVPTIMVVTSAQVPDGEQFLGELRRQIDAKGGALRLATVDGDQQPRVAAALRVQQVPTVLLLLLGQIQPLFEGSIPADKLAGLLDQVLEVARQQGMDIPDTKPAEETEPEEPLSPEMQAAYDAIQSGDLPAAEAAYRSLLTQNPADAEAKSGLAAVHLMQRTEHADLQEARAAAATAPQDLDAQLLVADLDMIGGHVDDAFDRLLDLLRGADPETKDAVRGRLLELFEVAGSDDPRVGATRKRLANLLF